MPMHYDIALLQPQMQPGVRRLLRRCKEMGVPAVVLETKRELATQMAYYSRGRASAELVRDYFRACKLWAITPEEAGVVATQTLYSMHLDGWAVDIAPAKPDGTADWNAPAEKWAKIYAIAEDECGLDACYAGNWNAWKWDRPHFEYHHEVQEA